MHVSWPEWLALMAAVTAGATVQGTVGFGSNLLAVPIVALIVPEALPGAMILPSLPMTVGMAVHERAHIDWQGTRFITLGRLPGVVLAVGIVALVPSDLLGVVAGCAVLIAVAISVFGGHPRVTPRTAAGAGFASGTLGTAAAIDGPPLALLYQGASPHVFRATLSTQFVIGTPLSLAGLLLADQLHAWQVLLGLTFIPALLFGLWLGVRLRPALHGRELRPIVLAIAAGAGVLAIVRALL